MQYKLSIIIPVFNKCNFTKSCLRDLSYLPLDHQIIVINNGSTDDTKDFLMSLGGNSKRLIIINNEKNLGFAKACNQGYNVAESDNILFLNNDIRVNDNKVNWTKELIDNCNKYLCGPTFGELNSNLEFVKESNSELTGKYSYLSGWCLAGNKNSFNKLILKDHVGPFSQEFGLAYFEDTDLSFRARKLNIKFKCIHIPVVHFGKQSSSQLNTGLLYKEARKIFINKWAKK